MSDRPSILDELVHRRILRSYYVDHMVILALDDGRLFVIRDGELFLTGELEPAVMDYLKTQGAAKAGTAPMRG